MTEPAAGGSAQREQRWVGLIVALLVFCAIPLVPPLRVVVPIEQALLIIIPTMAVCALVGWWLGGRLSIAVVWGALAILVLSIPDQTSVANFDRLARGWSLLLAASFGIVCVLTPGRDFLTRALGAIALAMAMAAGLAFTIGGTAQEIADVVLQEFVARNQEFVDAYQAQLRDSDYLRKLAETNPNFATFAAEVPQQFQNLAVSATSVFPALLALESLAVLTLAWSIFHRLSRTRIGEPLGGLGEFRFDDQFIWGLLLGVTMLILPSLGALHSLGWMLVVFFGGLYAVRGLGVAVWALRTRGRMITALAVVFVLAVPPYAVAILLGLGVGDTWVDWRRRPQSAT